MRTVQDIAFGVTGQIVYYDAPEGRATSVTSATVYRWDVADDSSSETAIGAAAVETNPNTTIDADSGTAYTGDARRLNVAATTDMAIGRSYLVTAADGLNERFEVSEIDSGNYVIAKHPLHNPYTTADTVKSTRIQATIDSTWVADETNLMGDDVGPNPGYRIRWVYVVSSATYVADTYFNLVRYVSKHGVTPQDIEVMAPGWLDMLPTDHRADQGRKLIDNAHREVKIDFHQIDIADSSVAEAEIIDELTRYKTLELGEWARYLKGAIDEAQANAASKRYQTRLDSLARIVSRIPVRDSTGAATPVIATGLTRR